MVECTRMYVLVCCVPWFRLTELTKVHETKGGTIEYRSSRMSTNKRNEMKSGGQKTTTTAAAAAPK